MIQEQAEAAWAFSALSRTVAAIAVCFLAACGGDETAEGGSGEEDDPAPAPQYAAPGSNTPGVHQVGPTQYEVVMEASEGGYNPVDVRVPVGAEVKFRVKSTDIPHGFLIDGAGLKLSPVPDVYVEAVHVFDAAREHVFYCDEYCGAGHDRMRGRVIVYDPANVQ